MANFSFKHMRPGFWLGIVALVLMLLLGTIRCSAQEKQPAVYDTIRCNIECIQKYVTKSTPKTVRMYAVYVDKENNIMDLISVSKTVYDYILMCREYGIEPQLGIKLKNGEVYSIVKLKRKIRWKK